jgi:hypothetical protein
VLGLRSAEGYGHQEAFVQLVEIEATAEATGESGEVLIRMLAKGEHMG